MTYLSQTRNGYGLMAISTFLLALLMSCNHKVAPQPVQHFSLTIALSEPLGDIGKPLPGDIKSLLKPLEAKNCSNFLFVPDVTIVRLDVQDATPEILDLGKDQNEVEKRMGKALTFEKARKVREEALSRQQITSLMAQPKGPEPIAISNTKKLLAASANQPVLTTEGTKQLMASALSTNNVLVAFDLTDLPAKIASTLCGKPGENPTPKPSVIIYRSGFSNDEIIKTLHNENVQAGHDPTLLKSVDEKIKTSTDSSDYRFTYERVKNRIYGQQHHE